MSIREVLQLFLCFSFPGKKDGKQGKLCHVVLHNLTLENKYS